MRGNGRFGNPLEFQARSGKTVFRRKQAKKGSGRMKGGNLKREAKNRGGCGTGKRKEGKNDSESFHVCLLTPFSLGSLYDMLQLAN